MARLPRVSPIGVPQHIIQRGNNHQICFAREQDYIAYVGWLKAYAAKFEVDIHAWVLMTNHVHLLCTPRSKNSISQMMQGLGRQYVRYFNYNYQRTGTLWEGRYKSCLVQEETYLIHLYRYIESNPVRANMVDDPADYLWSSYQINALGKVSTLCTPHSLYLSLGRTTRERQSSYRDLFTHHVDNALISDIRDSINRGMAIGSIEFKNQVEALTGRRMQPKKQGRPLGWRKTEN